MMSIETVDSWVSHGGRQGVYRHKSEATDLRALLDPAGLGGFEVFLIESGT